MSTIFIKFLFILSKIFLDFGSVPIYNALKEMCINMSIGQRIKELRISAGLNKQQVADKLEMPYTTYNNYETDARQVGSDTLKKLSKLYNVTIDYLLENDFVPDTIAAHHDEEEWTAEELDEIERFKAYVKSKRK